MGIAKNFVVKNGLEVNSSLIVANSDTNKVGIASTGPRTTLDVRGGIAATDLNVTGVATITSFEAVTGIITNGHFGNIKVSGITTVGVFAPTDVRAVNVNATGVGTFAVGVITSLNGDNLNFGDVNSGVGSIAGILFKGGIMTSTALGAGIVTYFGDGGNLSNLPGASPGGDNLEVQYNATSGGVGVFTGNSAFTFNYHTLRSPSINVSAAATIAGITTADATGINVTGVITATSFSGNGAGLIGVASTDNIQTATDATFLANVNITGITTVASTLNVGTAVTANSTGINVEIGAGTGNAVGIITANSLDAALGRWVLGADGSNHYTFTGPGFTGAENDPALYLQRGKKYLFNNPMGAHPFRIQTDENGSAGTAYNDGITNNDVDDGTLIWDVQFDAPNILYYQCTSHAAMGGKIYIGNSGEDTTIDRLTVVGVATAQDFNSLSDVNFKENISTVDNALSSVEQMRGVSFNWKESGEPSYGVIAQELERILPELVHGDDPKRVNYNGIIGVLIEAVKELSAEVKQLKTQNPK
tara:strand:+ start:22640 stop:24235 length:1596 start_codon:yes stop_codon:yes gene_type:complete